MSTHEKLTRRHYLSDDYPALVELIRVSNGALGNKSSLSAEELQVIVEVPGFNPRADSFIFEDGGRIIAMSNQGFHPDSGHCWADSVVHPDYWGQGIGAELIRLTEARCLEWAEATLVPDQPVLLQLAASDRNARAGRLFEAHGYRVVRTFYEMRIDLGQPVAIPLLPDGLALRPFDAVRDAEAVYEAQMDAFSDHWGFERESYAEWAQYTLKHPTNDNALWLAAYDGDEIAGFCVNRAVGGDDPTLALVWVLGVRRPWRRRGLGEALLRTSFARFQGAGYAGAALMVDSSNATNAVGLYERAGMHIHKRRLVYHKTLRGASD
jgi:mycothiol synthase